MAGTAVRAERYDQARRSPSAGTWRAVRLVVFGQTLFFAAFVVALWWHRPAAVEPVRATATVVVVATVSVLLTVAAAGRRQPWLAALVATVQLLVAVGFALRMRVGAADTSALVLYVVGVVAAVAMFGVGRGLRPGEGYQRRRTRVVLVVVAVAVGSGLLLLGFADTSDDGARVSVSAAGQTLQPAELLRFCVIGFAAFHLGAKEPLFRVPGKMPPDLRRLVVVYAVVPAAVALALLAWVSDLGPAVLLVFGVVGTVVYVTRKWYHAVAAIVLFGPLAFVVTKLLHIEKVSERFALRSDPFYGQCADPTMCGYLAQPGKALLGYARGGLLGTSPGLGRPESIGWQRRNDYILAVAGEELGYVGILAIVGLYALLVVQLFRAATRARLPWVRAWAVGLAVMVTANVVLPLLGATAVLPVIGVTTPLLSAGGTSMVVVLAVIGLVAGAGATREAGASLASAVPAKNRFGVAPQLPWLRPARRGPGDGWERLLAPGLAGILAVLACVAFADAQLASATERQAEYDSDGTVARLQNATLTRGQIISADGQVLARTGRDGDGDPVREYPQGALAGAATGYLLPAFTFAEGVEGGSADVLECGQPDDAVIPRTVFGERCQPTDVHVSLDVGLSREVAEALNATRAPDGTSLPGAVVAMDPRDGRLLAVVSSGSYDPNCVVAPREYDQCLDEANRELVWNPDAAGGEGNYRSPPAIAETVDDSDTWGGLAVRHVDHPGSVFKLVTAEAGDPLGPSDPYSFTPRDQLRYGPGSEDGEGGSTLWNNGHVSCGGSLVDAIEASCNTAFALLGRDVGMPGLRHAAGELGFAAEDSGPGVVEPPCGTPPRVGTRCQVDGMEVAASRIDFQDSEGRTCHVELAAIGEQCVLASPMQMAMVVSAVAADGELHEPQLVTGFGSGGSDSVVPGGQGYSPGGQEYSARPPAPAVRVFSPEAAGVVTEGMVAAVNDGTASQVALTCAQVAAKTGTAQLGQGAAGTGFDVDAWMVAFAPADDPMVAVAVYLSAPDGVSISGGHDAAPVAKAVLQASLRRAGVC